jgi:hypothetical protein
MRNWDEMVHRAMRVAETAFGRNVTFQYGGPVTPGETAPEPVTLRAVFDEAHEQIDTSGGVPINTTNPICDVRRGDLPWQPDQGDTLIVDGKAYTVVDVQPDGAGTDRLILRSGALTRI